MKNKIIAIDIGGTFIKYGIYTLDGQELFASKEPTNIEEEGFFNQLCTIIDSLYGSCDEIEGIALSVPGFVNPVTGENTDFSIPKSFISHNLKTELAALYHCPVSIENDCNCAALAERDYGSGLNCDNFVMITIGTGIGGAIVINQKLVRGSNYKAGEIGFSKLCRDEEIGATAWLVQTVSEYVGRRIDGEYVINNLKDNGIYDIYVKWIEKLAILIGNVAAALDPQKVLIGGGISANPVFINDLRERVYELYPFREYTSINSCHFKNDAGKIGALSRFLEEYR